MNENHQRINQMKIKIKNTLSAILATVIMAIAVVAVSQPTTTQASGGSGGGSGVKVDSIKVSKCFYDAPTGEMLIKAASSDVTAHLYAFRPDGTYQGEVQNGGGSRYGGTVMGYIPDDPQYMVIVSSSAGSIVVPTAPFQL